MYVDGFLVPLTDANVETYRQTAELFATKAKELGAYGSVETIGDGLEHGHTTDFYRAVQAQEGENVVLSFILWPDKATRDTGWEKMMADPDLQPGMQAMPFDGRRMFWGGFNPIVSNLEIK